MKSLLRSSLIALVLCGGYAAFAAPVSGPNGILSAPFPTTKPCPPQAR